MSNVIKTLKFTVEHEVHGQQTMYVPYQQRHDVEIMLLEKDWIVLNVEVN